jgi:NTE family protein
MGIKELRAAFTATPIRGAQPDDELAVMLTGGGARAAYQVGLIRGIARHFPNLKFKIVTGVSAGAINAVFLASSRGSLNERAEQLARLWMELECSHIYQFDWRTLIPFRSALAGVFPRRKWSRPRALVDTTPLAHLLRRVLDCDFGEAIPGIVENIRDGELSSVALMTLDYSTGQSVRWVQGRQLSTFEGSNRRAVPSLITV